MNGSGKLVYGYNFQLKKMTGDKVGWWRLTFSIDPVATYTVAASETDTPVTYTVTANTYFATLDPSDDKADAKFRPVLKSPTESVLELQVVESKGHGGGGGGGGLAVVLLRFVAVYSIFDMMNVIFAAGLKGAGDTRYPLLLTVVLSWVAMLGPAWIACVTLGGGVFTAWTTAAAYVVLLGLLMLRRFQAGGWKSLRVIEPHVPEMDEPPSGAPAGAEPA